MRKTIIIACLFITNVYAGIGTESCHCYNVSFNKKLTEYKLPEYNVAEFKAVKKGAKKMNADDLYKYAIFILTNDQHNLIDLEKEIEKEDKPRYQVFNEEQKRIHIASNYLVKGACLGHAESQFLFAFFQLKQKTDFWVKAFLERAVNSGYEPAIELLAQLYLAGNQIEINATKPFEKDEKYKFYNTNILEASKLLQKLPNNKNAQFEMGKIYLTKEYNQYNQNIDMATVRSLFESIGELAYLNEKIKHTNDYKYLINYSNLFPKISLQILSNESIEENQAYELINQFSHYESFFSDSNSKNLKYSLLGKTKAIQQNIYPEYEKYIFNHIEVYSYFSIDKSNWYNDLSKEKSLELLKILNVINKGTAYLEKFIIGNYIEQTKEILDKAYYDSRLFFQKLTNKESFHAYSELLPKSPYAYEFENKYNSSIQLEKMAQEKMTQEANRIENAKQEKIRQFQPQIDAFEKLAQNYAYSYMKQMSPATGKNASYSYEANNFENNERQVTLKWEAKFTSSAINEYIGSLAGLSNPYETYELYGVMNIKDGSFTLKNQNAKVTALKNFNEVLKTSKEFAIYAIKGIVNLANTVNNSTAYTDNYSQDNYKSTTSTDISTTKKIEKNIEFIEDRTAECSNGTHITYYKVYENGEIYYNNSTISIVAFDGYWLNSCPNSGIIGPDKVEQSRMTLKQFLIQQYESGTSNADSYTLATK